MDIDYAIRKLESSLLLRLTLDVVDLYKRWERLNCHFVMLIKIVLLLIFNILYVEEVKLSLCDVNKNQPFVGIQ